MGYDGLQMIAEYNSSNALQRRYVYGPGTDELLVWYEGTNTSTRYYHHTDERGSVIALSKGDRGRPGKEKPLWTLTPF